MRFASREKRRAILGFFFGQTPEILIATISGLCANKNYDGSSQFWDNFGVTLLVLYVVYFLVWLKKSIWSWISFYIFKKETVKNMQAFFRDNQFPKPPEFANSVSDYLQEIIDDEDVAIKPKIAASELIGFSQGVVSTGFVQAAFRMAILEEAALTEYRNSFPPEAQE